MNPTIWVSFLLGCGVGLATGIIFVALILKSEPNQQHKGIK